MSLLTITSLSLLLIGTTFTLALLHRSLFLSQLWSPTQLKLSSFEPPRPPPQTRPYLNTLPPRPHLDTAPLDPSTLYARLSAQIHGYHAQYTPTTYLSYDTHQGQETALLSRRRGNGHTHYAGEICRVAPGDCRTDVALHPADAEAVVGRGWGERAGGSKVRLQAPRDGSEVELVMQVVRAAAWWVGGMWDEV